MKRENFSRMNIISIFTIRRIIEVKKGESKNHRMPSHHRAFLIKCSEDYDMINLQVY